MAVITYPRQSVMELCRALGHDPEKVSLITISPISVTVEYVHPISERPHSYQRSDRPDADD